MTHLHAYQEMLSKFSKLWHEFTKPTEPLTSFQTEAQMHVREIRIDTIHFTSASQRGILYQLESLANQFTNPHQIKALKILTANADLDKDNRDDIIQYIDAYIASVNAALEFTNSPQVLALETGKVSVKEALLFTEKDQVDALEAGVSIKEALQVIEHSQVNGKVATEETSTGNVNSDDANDQINNPLYVEISGENSNTPQVETSSM